jgi:hypothetical protein
LGFGHCVLVIDRLFCFRGFDLDHLPALVEAAIRAGFVRPDREIAIFAHGQIRLSQMIVAAALVAAGPGLVLLWYCHESEGIN